MSDGRVECGTAALADNEVMLRGGHLEGPIVYTLAFPAGGKTFLPLWKTDPVLTRFLTPGSLNGNPLAGTTLFEKIVEVRRVACGEALATPAPADQRDKADDLGLDEPGAPQSKRRHRRGAHLPTPTAVEITVPDVAGGPWRLWVAWPRHPGAAPAMEATAHNVQRLLAAVSADLAENTRRERSKNVYEDRRGETGEREYLLTVTNAKGASKQVWRKRKRLTEPSGNRPYSRKYQQTTRTAAPSLESDLDDASGADDANTSTNAGQVPKRTG